MEDFKKLVREAEAEARTDIVAKRCWGFHKWTKWSHAERGQERTCLRCGLYQTTDRRCAHVWVTDEIRNLDTWHAAQQKYCTTGKHYILKCRRCGEVSQRKLSVNS